MLVCTLGDLTLDVIVRLAGPIADGGDTDAEIRVGPGGQAANVAAWAAELGASARFIGKTGADDAGELVRARLAGYGVEVVGPVDGRSGSICSLVSPDGGRSMAADRGHGAGPARRRDRPGMARRLRLPARLGLRAHGRAGAQRRTACGRARPRGGCRSHRRPGVVERNPRQRRRGVPRDRARPGARRRVRERGRGARRRPFARRLRSGSSSTARADAPSATTSARHSRFRAFSTRRAQEMRSQRAGSSAGPTLRSRQPRAASSRSARCR